MRIRSPAFYGDELLVPLLAAGKQAAEVLIGASKEARRAVDDVLVSRILGYSIVLITFWEAHEVQHAVGYTRHHTPSGITGTWDPAVGKFIRQALK